MATSRSRPPVGGPDELAAIGCWGACWYGGCWGGCWPGVAADPEVVEAVARSLAETTPPETGIGNMFKALADTVAEQARRR
jgi:hypothetical protein